MIDLETREYSHYILTKVTPKVPPPKEVRHLVRAKLLDCTELEFIERLRFWSLIPYSYGHLDHIEMIEVFQRLDRTMVKHVNMLKEGTPPEDIELIIENILKGAINAIDIVKEVDSVSLFKSLDQTIEILKYSTYTPNISLCFDILVIYRTILKGSSVLRKKAQVVKYLNKIFADSSWYCLTIAQFYLIFASKMEIYLDPNTQVSNIFDIFPIVEKLREYHLVDSEKKILTHDFLKDILCSDKEIPSKTKDDIPINTYLLRHLRYIVRDWDDYVTRQRHFSCFLKAISTYFIYNEEYILKEAFKQTEIYAAYNTEFEYKFSWEQVYFLMSVEAPPEFHCTVIRSKWNQTSREDADNPGLKSMKNILQQLLVRANYSLNRDQLGAHGEEIEQLLEEQAVESNGQRKLIVAKSQGLITEIVNAVKACFLFEDKHTAGGSQNSYIKIMELVCSLLQNHMSGDVVTFSPELINSILELLRLDIGSDSHTIKSILDITEDLIRNPRYRFIDEKGQERVLSSFEYTELVSELFEVVDSLFVEPNKSYYMTTLSQFAREVSEHSIWNALANLPEELAALYNSVVVVLDDILIEIPDNLITPTLERFLEIGLADSIINHYYSTDKLDFEVTSFYILFICKFLNCESQPKRYEEMLPKYIEKAFFMLLDRRYLAQNVMRFSGSDSTSTLVALAEELLNLVNVKHSVKDMILDCLDRMLDEYKILFDSIWRNIIYIIRGERFTDPFLTKYGWEFKGDIMDDIYFLAKIGHNNIKFFSKLYDVHRTDLHHSFSDNNRHKKILSIIAGQIHFDTQASKHRKNVSTLFSRMMIQSGNDSVKKTFMTICFQFLEDQIDEYLALKIEVIDGTQLALAIPRFLFRGNATSVAQSIANEGVFDDYQISNLLVYVNKYFTIMVVADLIKSLASFSENTFQFDGDKELKRIYPKYIKVELSLLQPKVEWFTQRLSNWRDALAVGRAKGPIAFQEFSDYMFGSSELFTYETANKSMEKILKSLNITNKQEKAKLISDYSYDCGKILGEFEFENKLTFRNAFLVAKRIQCFAYLMSNFDGRIILISLFESGALDFCKNAIIFGFKFLKKHINSLLYLKSIKEKESADGQKTDDPSLEIDDKLNDLKYTLESLCPKLNFCWDILLSYFKNTNIDNYSSNLPAFKHLLNKSKFNKARKRALEALHEIFSELPYELYKILDPEFFYSQTQLGERPSHDQRIAITLNEVSKGYDILKLMHNFVNHSLVRSMEVFKYLYQIQVRLRADEVSSENQEHPPAEQEQVQEVEAAETQPVDDQMEQEEKIVGDNLSKDIHFRGIPPKEFKLIFKRKVLDLWGVVFENAHKFHSVFKNFKSHFVKIILEFDFVNPKKFIEKKSALCISFIQELEGNIFTKDEPRSSKKGKRAVQNSAKHLQEGFVKEFITGDLETVQKVAVYSRLLKYFIAHEQSVGLGLDWEKEYIIIAQFTTELLKSLYKLAKYAEKDTERWEINYRYITGMLDNLIQVLIQCMKTTTCETPKQQSLERKRSQSKSSAPLLSKSEVTSKLTIAIVSYLSIQGPFISSGVDQINLSIIGNAFELLSQIVATNSDIKESFITNDLLKQLLNIQTFGRGDDKKMEAGLQSIRSLISLIESLFVSRELIEKQIEQEIRYFFYFQESNAEANYLPTHKQVKYDDFKERFRVIQKTRPEAYNRVLKCICVVHIDGDKYIALKEPRNYVTNVDHLPEESIKIIKRIIKEIVRGICARFSENTNSSSQSIHPFSALVFILNFLAVRRYPILLPFLMRFNLSKIIKSLKCSNWITKRMQDTNINYFQFFMRIFVFLDPKNYVSCLVDIVESSNMLIESQKGGIYLIDSDIRALIANEISEGLHEVKDSIIDIINSKRSKTNYQISLEEYYKLKQLTSYGLAVTFMSNFVEGVKMPCNPSGELNIASFVKYYTEVYQNTKQETFSGNFSMQRMIEAPFTYLLKLNFLIIANSKLFEKYNSLYNLKNPRQAKLQHLIHLNDFTSFRTQWPQGSRQDFSKSCLVLETRMTRLQDGSLRQGDRSPRSPVEEVVEIMLDATEGENILEEMRNFNESENHSIGGQNRLILVHENHNLEDPFEDDPVLSELDELSQEGYTWADHPSENEDDFGDFDQASADMDDDNSSNSQADEGSMDIEEQQELAVNLNNITQEDLDQLRIDLGHNSQMGEDELNISQVSGSSMSGDSLLSESNTGRSLSRYSQSANVLGTQEKIVRKPGVDDCLKKQIECYPFTGRIDFAGLLNVSLNDEQSETAISELLNALDELSGLMKDNEEIKRITALSKETTTLRAFVNDIITKNSVFPANTNKGNKVNFFFQYLNSLRGGILRRPQRNRLNLNEESLQNVSLNLDEIFMRMGGENVMVDRLIRDPGSLGPFPNRDIGESLSAIGRMGTNGGGLFNNGRFQIINMRRIRPPGDNISRSRSGSPSTSPQRNTASQTANIGEIPQEDAGSRLSDDIDVIDHRDSDGNQLYESSSQNPIQLFDNILDDSDNFDFKRYNVRETFLSDFNIPSIFFKFLDHQNKVDLIRQHLSGAELKRFENSLLTSSVGRLGTLDLTRNVFSHERDEEDSGSLPPLLQALVNNANEVYNRGDSSQDQHNSNGSGNSEEDQNEDENEQDFSVENDENPHNVQINIHQFMIQEADDNNLSAEDREQARALRDVDIPEVGDEEDEENGQEEQDNSIYNEQDGEVVNIQETLDLLNSVTPDLRQEILMSLENHVVQQLPDNIREEALGYRRGIGMMGQMEMGEFIGFGGDNMMEIESGDDHHDIEGSLEGEEEEDEANSKNFKKKNNKIETRHKFDPMSFIKPNRMKDSTLEVLISKLYSSSDTNNINPRIFSIVSANYFNQFKIFSTFFFILENPDLALQIKEKGITINFPPLYLDKFPLQIHDYEEVYEVVACKALKLFVSLVDDHTLFFIENSLGELESEGLIYLESISKLKSQLGISNECTPIDRLFYLLRIEKLRKSPEALEYLLRLIKKILIKHKKMEKLHELRLSSEQISLLYLVLTSDGIKEVHLNMLPSINSMLYTNKYNFDLFIVHMQKTVTDLVTTISKKLSLVLRLLKVAKEKSIIGDKEFIDRFINKNIDYKGVNEQRLLKVFRMIDQLFIKYFESEHKESLGDTNNCTEEADQQNKSKDDLEEGPTLGAKMRESVRMKFSTVLEDQTLKVFWVDLMELMDVIGQGGQKVISSYQPLVDRIQPLTECFFISFKILGDDEHLIKRTTKKQPRKKMSISEFELVGQSNSIETEMVQEGFERAHTLQMTEMFRLMCEKNKELLNTLIERDIRSINGAYSCIAKFMPRIISFKNKRSYFRKALKKAGARDLPMRCTVRRNEVFVDSYQQIANKRPQDIKGKLKISFTNEQGYDEGGLAREWFGLLSKEIFNPNYALFKPTANMVTFQPNPHSFVNPDHLHYFRFIGRIVGKALQEGYLFDAFFTSSFYKHMCGDKLGLQDMEDIDPDYYKNLNWILENDVEGLGVNFSYTIDNFGEKSISELMPDGEKISVTNDNKHDYVNKICFAKMTLEIQRQLEAFLHGVHDLIPSQLLTIFDHRELELMISGLPEINSRFMISNNS